MQWKQRLVSAAAGVALAASVIGSSTYAANVFSDVPPTHWSYNAVQWAAQYGIMVGPDNTRDSSTQPAS